MSEITNKQISKPYSKEEVEKILQEIDAKLLEFMKSGAYKEVLLAMGNLGKYSLINQMYIILQNPEAQTVNGMRQWNYLGRSIKPGEKALRIFAPIIGKVEKEITDEDGNIVVDQDGNPLTKKVEIAKAFKPTFVFDIAQTQGKELDVFKFNESISVKDKKIIINGISDVVAKNGFSIRSANEEELGKNCYGLCDYQEKQISLLENMSDLQTISTLIHEAGHSLAHGPYCKGFEGLTPLEKREIKEVEAESIACVVCSHLGLDTENFNFSYIAGWAEGDITKFRKNLDVISKHSLTLIEGIDDAFAKVRKEEKESQKKAESQQEVISIPTPKSQKRHEAVAV